MEAPRSRNPSRHALLWSALVVLVIGAGVTVLFVACNADGKGTKAAAPAGKGAAKSAAKGAAKDAGVAGGALGGAPRRHRHLARDHGDARGPQQRRSARARCRARAT